MSDIHRDDAEAFEEEARDKIMQLVGFMIGKELFGVEILMVQEIIKPTPITAIPNSPEFVEGVINLRGNIIPVIDLRKRLSLVHQDNLQERNTRIIIVSVMEKVTGFIVDSVSTVLKILPAAIKPPPDIVVAKLKSQYIQGVCNIDHQLLILLDFTKILLLEEIRELQEMEAN